MDTASDQGPAPRSPREELRRAADHLTEAAEDAVEVVMPRELRHHLRNAARHLFQAGVAAIDSADRRSRLRAERRARRHEREQQPSGAAAPLGDDIAGSHTPGCL